MNPEVSKLPPLPEGYSAMDWGGRDTGPCLYTQEHMRAYGEQCRAESIESAKKWRANAEALQALVEINQRHDERIAALSADREGDGVALIAAERRRQVELEGWTQAHDDDHATGELATAAACYAAPDACNSDGETGTRPRMAILAHWPWAMSWWKPGDRIRELVKSGALIAAEIDRLQRVAASQKGEGSRD